MNQLAAIEVPPGRLLLQTVRSHDQYNTTIYGLDDRYRGVHGGRRVVFVHPDDLTALGVADGDHGRHRLRVDRRCRSAARAGFRVVAYPTARGLRGDLLPGGERAGAARLHRRGLPDADLEADHRPLWRCVYKEGHVVSRLLALGLSSVSHADGGAARSRLRRHVESLTKLAPPPPRGDFATLARPGQREPWSTSQVAASLQAAVAGAARGWWRGRRR